ncbi:hypothetical protein SSABA_v1c00760 [Spiroplasma sabaudiense Ar-1343]|uniref:Transmembrane protein n=1 Tax=Spiroplasma sabaudiense Ar-1343 TaxID=1276257 RepID=W6A8J0_9MOLU|nr:hypothetical protein [Spiroplasma sabaudiense]AHI53488.1 hypothetical protein SSABA_v1c00760 [Spiroplasma sabaudiense Ar-1343]
MEIQKFRKITKKPVLWIGAINAFILIMALTIILNINFSLITKITLTSQFVLDLIIINSVIGILNFGKTSISFLYESHFEVNTENNQAKSVEFKTSKYCHVLAITISIVSFFIIVASTSIAKGFNIQDSFRVAWAPALILGSINISLLYLNFFMTTYLLNSSEEIKKSALKWRIEFQTNIKKDTKEQTEN